jgi:Icc-related predicted phosphoesterase
VRAPSGHLIFFATDIHGSEVCFRKWLNAGAAYGADVLIMGGDLTGKVIVPVHTINGHHRARWQDEEVVLETGGELVEFRRRVADAGAYVWPCDLDQAATLLADEEATERLFVQLASERLAEWVALADERVGDGTKAFIIAGNDDAPEVDSVLAEGRRLQLADNRVVQIDDWLPMVSLGESTPTPWDSPRELTEEEYGEKLERLISSAGDSRGAIWNLHVPPYASSLDDAPALTTELAVRYSVAGDVKMLPVGSPAVRSAIERHQPLLGLHGHVHEGRGRAKIGRTICFNPGSSYQQGILCGVLVRVDRKGVRDYTLTTG